MRIFTRLLILLLLCLGGAASAFAVPTVSLSSGGNGVFVLQASGLHSIGGVQVILNYDTSTLTNPRVTAGPLTSGALMLPNTGTPGLINIPLAKAGGLAAESGVIATISFDLVGNPPGVITSLSAKVSNLAYKTFAARTINPFTRQTPDSTADASGGSTSADNTAQTDTTSTTDTESPAAATDTATGTTGTTTTTTTASQDPSRTLASGPGALLVTNTAPSAPPEENKRSAAEAPAEVAQEQGAPQESEPAASDTPAVASIDLNQELQPLEQRVAAEAKPSRVVYRSVLEQLRGFTGKSTPKALSELFANQSLEGVRQEPAIALADGSSKVRVFVAPRSHASGIPNFSLSGASLVALTPEPDGSWLVEVLPAKGSYHATITMLQGGAETVIPLLVAPPMGAGEQGRLTESGFARFLAERGTEKAPRFDLNGDGRRDYIDDYIFTANYLARQAQPLPQKESTKPQGVGKRGAQGNNTAK